MPLIKEKTYIVDDIYALPEDERAELIDGQIYYMAPSTRKHQDVSMELSSQIKAYVRSKGAPDWIIEIVSPASRRMDYYTKLFKYRTAGVREYWIVDPDKDRIFVYHFVAESAEEESMEEYTLKDSVKAGIYDELVIDFGDMDVE